MKTQINEFFFSGTHTERLDLVLKNIPENYVFYEDDTTFAYIKVDDVWKPFPGALVNQAWGKYVVSSDPNVHAPYPTIGQAITAIIAAGVFPASVLIMPGTYTEDVILPPGVYLDSLSGPFAATLAGNVTVGGPVASNRINGLIIHGQIFYSGISATLVIIQCRITAGPGLDAVVASGTDATSAIIINDSVVRSRAAPGQALKSMTPVHVISRRSTFQAAVDAASSAALFECTDVLFRGRVTQTGPGLTGDFDINTSSIECIQLLGGGQVTQAEGSLVRAGTFGPLITSDGSPGTLATLREFAAGSADAIDQSVPTSASRTARLYQFEAATGSPPYSVTSSTPDVFTIDNGTLGVLVNLDPVRSFPDGSRRTIRRKLGATGDIEIFPDGIDTIEGQTGYSLGTGVTNVSAGVTLQANWAAQEWEIVNSDKDVEPVVSPTVPGAYPYTTLDTDEFVEVDTGSGAHTIKLGDGNTFLEQIIADAGDNAAANPITVGLDNAAKSLNGAVNGTVPINVNGGFRGFWRDTSGNWHGGV